MTTRCSIMARWLLTLVTTLVTTTVALSQAVPPVFQKISAENGNMNFNPYNLHPGDTFGCSMDGLGDLDGDGVNDIVVGAMLEDWGGDNKGAAYVLFLNPDYTVKSNVKISALSGLVQPAADALNDLLDDDDRFGSSVANVGDIDGDGITDIAVGSGRDDDGTLNSGAVYILFLQSDGRAKSVQKISNLEGGLSAFYTIQNQSRFGQSVQGIGDLDGDTIPDIVVGAYFDSTGAQYTGACYVLFLNADGTVKSAQKLTGQYFGGDASDRFGVSVANVGDLDGDGVTDIAIGAHGDDDGVSDMTTITDSEIDLDPIDPTGSNTGAVYICFLNTNGTVKSYTKISAAPGSGFEDVADYGARFGFSLEGIGDINGDDTADLLMGTVAQNQQGAAYLLFLNHDGTLKSHMVVADGQNMPAGEVDDFDDFGSSVAVVEPASVVGLDTLVVGIGARQDDDLYDNAGAVYVIAPPPTFVPPTIDAEDLTVQCGSPTDPLTIGMPTVTIPAPSCEPPAVTHTDNTSTDVSCPAVSVIDRTWTMTDNCNNTVSALQVITVVDTVAPELTVPVSVDYELPVNDYSPSVAGTATATDGCSTVTISYADEFTPGCGNNTGIVNRVWTAEDACGNAVSRVQRIGLTDTTPPVLTIPANVLVGSLAQTTPSQAGFASATDNSGLAPTIDYVDTSATETSCSGALTRTWTATDACGNTSSGTQTITYGSGGGEPILTLPPNADVTCRGDVSPDALGFATAEDNEGALPVSYRDSQESTAKGETVIARRWSATNSCGTTTRTQMIKVGTSKPPVIDAPANTSVECIKDAQDLAVTGEAMATFSDGSKGRVTYSDVVNGSALCGTVMRTWSVSDECGNVVSATQEITYSTSTATLGCSVYDSSPALHLDASGSPLTPTDYTGQAYGNCELENVVTTTDIVVYSITHTPRGEQLTVIPDTSNKVAVNGGTISFLNPEKDEMYTWRFTVPGCNGTELVGRSFAVRTWQEEASSANSRR